MQSKNKHKKQYAIGHYIRSTGRASPTSPAKHLPLQGNAPHKPPKTRRHHEHEPTAVVPPSLATWNGDGHNHPCKKKTCLQKWGSVVAASPAPPPPLPRPRTQQTTAPSAPVPGVRVRRQQGRRAGPEQRRGPRSSRLAGAAAGPPARRRGVACLQEGTGAVNMGKRGAGMADGRGGLRFERSQPTSAQVYRGWMDYLWGKEGLAACWRWWVAVRTSASRGVRCERRLGGGKGGLADYVISA